MFFPLVCLVVHTLTNQQFVNCAYLEILAIAPVLPVHLGETSPRALPPAFSNAAVTAHQENPVSRLPVERCLNISNSLNLTEALLPTRPTSRPTLRLQHSGSSGSSTNFGLW